MPPGTDCPYPIRILAFFEMIRPYHVVIRIWGKLLKNHFWICVSDTKQFYRRHNYLFPLNFQKGDFVSGSTINLAPILVMCCWLSIFIRPYTMSQFVCKLHRDMNRVNVFVINRCIYKWRIRIDTNFHWKNTDFPHEIVACLAKCNHSHATTVSVYCGLFASLLYDGAVIFEMMTEGRQFLYLVVVVWKQMICTCIAYVHFERKKIFVMSVWGMGFVFDVLIDIISLLETRTII